MSLLALGRSALVIIAGVLVSGGAMAPVAGASVAGQVVVMHAPVATSTYGRAIAVSASASCDSEACSASLLYRATQVGQGDGGWTRLGLEGGAPTTVGDQVVVAFDGVIPAAVVGTGGVDYFVEVRDGLLSGRWPAVASGAGSFWHVQTLSPPVVRHVPPAYARPDAAVTLDLSATCSSGSCAAEVYYRESPATMADSAPLQDGLVEDPQWARVAMRQTAALDLGDLGDELSFSGELPASVMTSRGADYYFRVTDGETSTLWPGTMYVGHAAPTDSQRVAYHHLHVLEPTRLVHQPPLSAPYGTDMTITGKATCPVTRVCTARLYWRSTDADVVHTDTSAFSSSTMTVTRGIGLDLSGTVDVSGTVPAAAVDTRGVDYFFSVSDGSTVAWYPGTTHVDGYQVVEGTQVGYGHVRVLEPPHIVIAPVPATRALEPYEVSAQVSCATPSCSVALRYTTDHALPDPPTGPQRQFTSIAMTPSAPLSTSALGDLSVGTVRTYRATIPADQVTTRGLAFQVIADDGHTSAYAPGLSYEGAYVPRTDGSPTGPLYPTTNEWLGIDREGEIFGFQTHEADLAFPVRVLEAPHPVSVPPATAARGQALTVSATSNCSTPACTATLSWRSATGATTTSVMDAVAPLAGVALPAGSTQYEATIPAADTDADTVSYSVSVDDGYVRGDTPSLLVATNTLGLSGPQTTPLIRPSVTGIGVAANAEGWIGAGDHDVIVNAHGSMSGVREIELTAPTGSAPRVRTYPCLMGVVALCPTDWSQTFTIAQDDLPEGASDLQAVATDGLGTRSDTVVKTVKVDRSAPELQLGGALSDAADSWLDDRAYALAIAASDGSPSQLRSGVRSIELLVDDVRQAFAEQECPTGSCPMQRVLQVDAAELAEGRHDVRVVAIDQAGNRTQRSFSVGVDRRVPELVLTGALAGEPDGQPGVLRVAAREPDLAATGSGVVRLELIIDGSRERLVEQACPVGGCELSVEWLRELAADDPGHLAEVIARDGAGHVTRRQLIIGVDRVAPTVTLSGELADADGDAIAGDSALHVDADDGVSGVVRTEILLDGNRQQLFEQDCADGGCDLQRDWTLLADGLSDGTHTVSVVATDAAGHDTRREITFDWHPNGTPKAPKLNMTQITPFAQQTAFLYTGTHPVQTGVSAGTINQRRAAVIRGTLTDRSGQPVSGATVTITGHPEYGQTTSRHDGGFYIAVNGGGPLTAHIEHDGFLAVDRQVDVRWQTYAFIEDTVLVRLDPNVTQIDSSDPLPASAVHRGSLESDATGQRQATLLFPQGLQASLEMPDGSTRPLPAMHVRATEYTVGQTGPAAMPGPLPATSAYTYAADFSIDEARAAGARHVNFTKPVIAYLENFRNAPVGVRVPNGYYERSTQQWVPDSDGRVIKVLSETDAIAALDVSGSGQAASTQTLATLGIDEDELRHVADLYAPGQELWRVPTRHFSDFNFGLRVLGAALPAAGAWLKGIISDPCHESGSVIECENQTLGEDLAVTGTGIGLHYRSDRVAGRTADRTTIDIPLTGASPPSGLIAVELRVDVAGRRWQWRGADALPATPNSSHTFHWDGKDAFGRTLQGAQQARISVGYVYETRYRSDAPSVEDTSRGFGVPPDGTAFEFGGMGDAAAAGSEWWKRPHITVWKPNDTTIGGWDARAAGLGGWTLTPHHQYDPVSHVLYRGDGSRQAAQTVDRVINRFAGTGYSWDPPTIGPKATEQPLHGPEGMDVGPDGSVYIADFYNDVIRRVTPTGEMVIVAGRQRPSFNQPRGYSGDGGPATDADLYIPRDVEVGPDGSLYIADHGNHRVRKVNSQGIITTIAGNGTETGARGDNGPATQATIRYPHALALAPDGTLFISQGSGQYSDHRIRRVGTDTTITTYAGGGTSSANDIRATSYSFHGFYNPLQDIALAPDGSLYVVDGQLLHKITPDGFITKVASDGRYSYEHGITESRTVAPALDATIDARAVTVTPDGSVYIVDSGNQRIWRLDDGKIGVVAGDGVREHDSSKARDGGPALEARFGVPQGITTDPAGAIYISDWSHDTVRKISDPLPGFTGQDIAIASQDAGELYQFDKTGRHLQTRDTTTGRVTQTFRYTNSGRLDEIEDAHHNTIGIERDNSGEATAVVAPFGQRTELDLDTDGYLAAVRDPAARSTTMGYVRDGLLSTFTRPGGVTSQMSYDAGGRLIRDENADGAVKTLARSDSNDAYQVTLTTGMGRTKTNRVERTDGAATVRTMTGHDGLSTQTRTAADATTTTTGPDGGSLTSHRAGDPRFGLQAPYPAKIVAARPSGASATLTATRSVDLADPDDTLSVRSITNTATIGTRTTTSRWDKAAGTLTTTLPSGLAATTTFDALGQLIGSHAPGVSDVSYRYDSHGRPVETIQGERSSTATYDAAGWLDTSTDALGRTTRYTHDALGRVTKTTLPDGREIALTYTTAGDLESVTPPARPAHSFLFTLTGLRDTWKAANDPAAVTRYRYDADQQLAAIDQADGSTINVDRDSAGRVSQLRHGTWNVDYDYHPTSGRLSSVTADDGTRTAWTYDGVLPLTETATGAVSGQTMIAYDNEGRVTSSTVQGTPAVTYAYDADDNPARIGALTLTRNPTSGQLTTTTLDASTTALDYSTYGELSALTARHNDSIVFGETYDRDRAGRVTTKTEQIAGQTRAYEYTYDPAGRLASVKRDGTTIAAYDYDANGNRTTEDLVGAAPVTAQYDDHDRLLRHGTATYRYTSNGELRERTTATGESTIYSYDAAGSLTGVELADGRAVSYVTDGLGRRIATKINGTLTRGFLYGEGDLPSAETDADGQIRSRFVYATRTHVPEYMQRGGRTYRLIADQLGSVRLVVDTQTGEIAQRIDYDPYGAITTDTNPGFQPFAYAGGLYDTDTGLVRFGARDYDPQTGRWTAKDPIDFQGGDTNLYGYVHGDPINLIDPEGTFAFIPIAIAVIGAASTGYDINKALHGCGSAADLALAALGPFGKLGKVAGASRDAARAGDDVANVGTDLAVRPKLRPSQHYLQERKMERRLRTADVLDAYKNPLAIGKPRYDEFGRPSILFQGRSAQVVVNPQTGEIVTAFKTGSRTRRQLLRRAGLEP